MLPPANLPCRRRAVSPPRTSRQGRIDATPPPATSRLGMASCLLTPFALAPSCRLCLGCCFRLRASLNSTIQVVVSVRANDGRPEEALFKYACYMWEGHITADKTRVSPLLTQRQKVGCGILSVSPRKNGATKADTLLQGCYRDPQAVFWRWPSRLGTPAWKI